MTANTIVQEIHSAFSVAEEQLLTEANSILAEASDKKKMERIDTLRSMGFGNSAPVRRLSPEEKKKAERLLHYKQRYGRIAPQYKFITEEKLLGICKKYGIVVGSSERYIEEIPEANMADITNFKILDDTFLEVSDSRYARARHTTKDGKEMHPSEMTQSHIENLIRMFARGHNIHGDTVVLIQACVTQLYLWGHTEEIESLKSYWKRTSPVQHKLIEQLFTPIKTTYFYVAANVDSFDTKGTTLKDNMLIEKDTSKELAEAMRRDLMREYDPIVLAKVEGGYLIVTAWGAEASDEEVMNPTRN